MKIVKVRDLEVGDLFIDGPGCAKVVEKKEGDTYVKARMIMCPTINMFNSRPGSIFYILASRSVGLCEE